MSYMTMPNSIFLHIPRTGGTWVNHVSEKYVEGAVVDHDKGHVHFPRALEFNPRGKRYIAFVRSPLEWYKSYFCRRVELGWTNCPEDHAWRSDNFHTYIERVLNSRYTSGYVSNMYRLYFQHSNIKIGKYENLVEDYIAFLKHVGEKFDEEGIRNTGKKGHIRTEVYTYSPEQEKKMKELEKEAILKYNY